VFPAGRAGLEATAAQGVVGAVAQPLFEAYLIPFELTSILLLAAIVGAVVLAKRRI
jgi:NADH-quinone oxidoreductase subunit J